MADVVDLHSTLGPGTVAATRSVVFRCAWPGKDEVMIGNFDIASDHGEDAIRAEAARLISEFTTHHLPDGTPPPDIIAIEPGALRWVPDDTEWRRTHG